MTEAAARKAAEEKVLAEAAERKVAEDARIKGDETGRKVDGKPQPDTEGKPKAVGPEAALVLSEQDRTKVQVALNSLGYEFPTVTGYFGPRTRAAIMAWQKKQGLQETGLLACISTRRAARTGHVGKTRRDEV